MKILSQGRYLILLYGLAGCALQPPTAESLATVPVVEFGDKPPKNGEFVLHFPAGKAIPVVTSISGSALTESSESTSKVSLKKDIYAYKEWVSFDGKDWQKGDSVLNINADIKIPSVQHPEPGLVKLLVDFK
ncbi:MAG: hypothetical protein IPN42_01010 [Methylococcaceae bacterium]|nr:hypothetical protein [Methylococcaceae bacterium]